jgi:hypothetical protein
LGFLWVNFPWLAGRRGSGDRVSEEDSENLVSTFLGRYGLKTERPSKAERRQGKTPDFRVLENDALCFFCEVKSVRGDAWLDRAVAAASPMQIVGGSRPDPAFNRLTNDIHTAVKQFTAVNSDRRYPNVLAFVNYEPICGIQDVAAVVTGNAYTDDGEVLPIYRQYSEGRMREDRLSIDLYLWLETNGGHNFLFIEENVLHHQTLCRCFGKNPASIKRLPTLRA